MEKDRKKPVFIRQPEYAGGPKALSKFLYEQLRYPKLAFEAKVQGTVLVEYDIDYQGVVIDTRVVQGLGHGCDEEAARVVRMLKFDVPKNRGMRVVFHQKARIEFRMPKAVPLPDPAPQQNVPAGQMQINYVFTTEKPAAAPEKKVENVFSYTIHS